MVRHFSRQLVSAILTMPIDCLDWGVARDKNNWINLGVHRKIEALTIAEFSFDLYTSNLPIKIACGK